MDELAALLARTQLPDVPWDTMAEAMRESYRGLGEAVRSFMGSEEALARLKPPLRVEAFNEVAAGRDSRMAMIVSDEDPTCARILAQQMTDQDAHDICDIVNRAALSANIGEDIGGGRG